MKVVTKVGLLLTASMMSIGLLGSPASAYVDSSWGCGGPCAVSNR